MADRELDWVAVGDRLRRIRNDLGESQREFGRHFGVSQNMISQYERGRARASVEFYVHAAALGNKSIDWLMTGQGDRAARTLREMRDLHDRMKSQLAVVRHLIEHEAGTASNPEIAALTDPGQLRDALVAEDNLPACLREVLYDPVRWRQLAMTGREVCALRSLTRAFGEMSREGLAIFLRLVRRDMRRPTPPGAP